MTSHDRDKSLADIITNQQIQIQELKEENQFLNEELDRQVCQWLEYKENNGDFTLYNENQNRVIHGANVWRSTLVYARKSDNRLLHEWKIEDWVGTILAQTDHSIRDCIEAMQNQNKDKSIPQIIWKSYSED